MTDFDGIAKIIREFASFVTAIAGLVVAVTAYVKSHRDKKELIAKTKQTVEKVEETEARLDDHMAKVEQSLRESTAINGPFANRRKEDKPVQTNRRR